MSFHNKDVTPRQIAVSKDGRLPSEHVMIWYKLKGNDLDEILGLLQIWELRDHTECMYPLTSIISWRSFDLHNWSTKLLYMVKIGHFVTLCHTNVMLCHTLFELNGHFQYLVLFGLLNMVLVPAWTTHFGICPSLGYSLW